MGSKPKGKGAAMLIEAMREYGYNKDIDIMLGKVTSAPPSIKVQPEGYTFELDADDVVVGGSVADKLNEGDLVILISANDGQQWYVIDKAVMY